MAPSGDCRTQTSPFAPRASASSTRLSICARDWRPAPGTTSARTDPPPVTSWRKTLNRPSRNTSDTSWIGISKRRSGLSLP